MKKYIFLIAFVFLFSCAESGVKNALNTFFIAISLEDYETAYEYISDEDKKNVNFEAFKVAMATQSWFKNTFGMQNTSYKIISIDVKENKANAYVEITHPDAVKTLKNEIAQEVSGFISGEKSKSEKSVVMTKTTKKYKLRKENGAWKVKLL